MANTIYRLVFSQFDIASARANILVYFCTHFRFIRNTQEGKYHTSSNAPSSECMVVRTLAYDG